jgi:predicted DNA-binding protein (UPF0251 family)
MREEETGTKPAECDPSDSFCALSLQQKLMRHIITLCLAAMLIAAAIFYSMEPTAGEAPKAPRRKLPTASASQPEMKPKLQTSTVAVEDEESAANRLADDQGLPVEERAKRLYEVLLRWAKRDLAAVTRWLLAAEADEGRECWFDALLTALAETQPRLAMEHGLHLNAAHPECGVPSKTLLGISLQHLTAEDAIRVMNQIHRKELRDTMPFTIHPQMDLKKLGSYVIEKSHLSHGDPKRPGIMPSNLVEVWIKRDLAAAYDFAMAMHDVKEGAFSGYETIQFVSAYAEMATPAEATRMVREILTNQKIEITKGDMALTFISQGEKKTQIMLKALEALPAAERDEIGEHPLLLVLFNSDTRGKRQLLDALRIFGTRDGRLRTINRYMKFAPERRTELQRHLITLGHTTDEVAFLSF